MYWHSCDNSCKFRCPFLKIRISVFQYFQMSIEENKTAYLENVFYLIVMLMQLFIPCYYGSEIYAVSERLGGSMFFSDWIEEDKKFKVAMMLFLEKVKRPRVISIFGVYVINLETFRVICKSAYSLYAVINTMNRK